LLKWPERLDREPTRRLMRRWAARCAGRQAGAHRDHRSRRRPAGRLGQIVSSGLVHRINSGTLTSPSCGPGRGSATPRAAALAPLSWPSHKMTAIQPIGYVPRIRGDADARALVS